MIEQDIVKLYNCGLNIKEIAERVNFSYEKIRQILKKQGVKWHRNYISDFTPEQIQTILQKFDHGISIKDLAKWYEISPPAISRLLQAHNREPIWAGRKYNILRQTPLNAIQKQIIVGSLLGDGCLHKSSKKSNYYFSFGHCQAQMQYFHWKIAMMDPFINNYYTHIDKRKNSIMLQTKTICHQDLIFFAHMFYDSQRIKHIPDKLDLYLTPLALAVWVQDDGNLNMGVNMRLATMSFTEQENYKLQSYLKQCFDLKSKVMEFKMRDKKYYQLTLNKENTQKLSDLIRPHITECMKYKIMPESSTTKMLNANKCLQR